MGGDNIVATQEGLRGRTRLAWDERGCVFIDGNCRRCSCVTYVSGWWKHKMDWTGEAATGAGRLGSWMLGGKLAFTSHWRGITGVEALKVVPMSCTTEARGQLLRPFRLVLVYRKDTHA